MAELLGQAMPMHGDPFQAYGLTSNIEFTHGILLFMQVKSVLKPLKHLILFTACVYPRQGQLFTYRGLPH